MSETPHRPEPAFLAKLDEARDLAEAGAFDDALAALTELWMQSRGHHEGNALRALSYLTTAYGRTGRHFEALALGRHHAQEGERLGSIAAQVVGWGNALSALSALGAHELLAASLPKLERFTTLDHPNLAFRARVEVYECKLVLAGSAGRYDEVERLQDEMQELLADAGSPEPEVTAWVVGMNEANLALQQGDLQAARSALQDVAAIEGMRPEQLLDFDLLDLRVAAAAKDEPGALAASERLLGYLQDEGRGPAWASRRVALAFDAGAALDDAGFLLRQAEALYDMAAAAVLVRIAQLDDMKNTLEALGLEDDPADMEMLAKLSGEFGKQRQKFLERVANLLQRHPHVLRERVLTLEEGEEWICICAWCGRVKSLGGPWLPIGHFVPPGMGLRATHGMCGPCRVRFADGQGTGQAPSA